MILCLILFVLISINFFHYFEYNIKQGGFSWFFPHSKKGWREVVSHCLNSSHQLYLQRQCGKYKTQDGTSTKFKIFLCSFYTLFHVRIYYIKKFEEDLQNYFFLGCLLQLKQRHLKSLKVSFGANFGFYQSFIFDTMSFCPI